MRMPLPMVMAMLMPMGIEMQMWMGMGNGAPSLTHNFRNYPPTIFQLAESTQICCRRKREHFSASHHALVLPKSVPTKGHFGPIAIGQEELRWACDGQAPGRRWSCPGGGGGGGRARSLYATPPSPPLPPPSFET